MSSSQFSLEALILGIPALGMLVAAFFRLDEMFATPRRGSRIGHPLSHRGEEGNFICIEPDGRYAEGENQRLALRRPAHLLRPGGVMAVQRVSVEWAEDGSKE
jgi:hypothetical protein